MTALASPTPPPGRDHGRMHPGTDQNRMSGLDTLVWNIENDPRLRSTVTAIFRFSESIDPSVLRHRLDRVSRLVPRMHQRVVADPLGIAPPRWETHEDFRLGRHFRLATLGGQGTLGQVHELAAAISSQALDRSIPLWEFTLVRGMTDGGSALIVKTHHALTDGVGGMQLMLELCDLDPSTDLDRQELPPRPAAPNPAAGSIDSEVRYEARQMIRNMSRAIDAVTDAANDPIDAAQRLGSAVSSARRVLSPVPEPESSVIGGRSLEIDFRSFQVPLEHMRSAGHRVGGTVNDAFVAGVSLGITKYHRRFDASLDSLRVSIPVNKRVDGDSVGNHFTPGKIRLDTSTDDPDELMRRAHREVDLLRSEPANALVEPVAGLLRFLPTVLSTTIASALFVGIDVAASNVPGSPVPLYLCGGRITHLIPFGPLVGCAANVTMVSFDGVVHVGVNSDPAAISDPVAFLDDLRSAFQTIVGDQ